MVIEKILKQLTPERAKKEIATIQKIKLPPELQKWVNGYQKVGERGDFIFLWLYRTVQLVTLPIIAKRYKQSLWRTKFLVAMFIILLDDVADKIRQKRLLNELLKIPAKESFRSGLLGSKQQRYFEFTIKLWKYIVGTIKSYPRYKDFKGIFNFDIAQLLNTMKYSYLVNTNPFLINQTEYQLYSSYSEQSIICFTLDLMCSSSFKIENLGIMRELGWHAQQMTRVGDCLSTWTREIKDKDYTSGVFAHAITSGVLTVSDLTKRKPAEIIERIKRAQLKKLFFKRWDKSYQAFSALIKQHPALNLKEVVPMPKKLIISHLSSKGFY